MKDFNLGIRVCLSTGRAGTAKVRKVTAENQGGCSQKGREVDTEDLRLLQS